MDRSLMTVEGLESLRAELHELETDGRARIAEQIRTAREWGDLKENAEYHAAKEAQAHLETRILLLREQELTAEVVEATGGDVAAFGSSVEVEDEKSGKRSTYQLVSQRDAAPAQGRVSIDAPMGTALAGRRAGDVAVLRTPRGERRLKVLAVG